MKSITALTRYLTTYRMSFPARALVNVIASYSIMQKELATYTRATNEATGVSIVWPRVHSLIKGSKVSAMHSACPPKTPSPAEIGCCGLPTVTPPSSIPVAASVNQIPRICLSPNYISFGHKNTSHCPPLHLNPLNISICHTAGQHQRENDFLRNFSSLNDAN